MCPHLSYVVAALNALYGENLVLVPNYRSETPPAIPLYALTTTSYE
jgi:hypothetical protein